MLGYSSLTQQIENTVILQLTQRMQNALILQFNTANREHCDTPVNTA